MDKLVRYVLKAIPNSYADEFPSFSVFESYSPWDAYVDEGKVFLSPSLINLPKDVAIGTLAHEFAHVFLEHTGMDGLQEDHEADALACQWGFIEEIKAMRQHFGPATDGRS
jgi:hypothetical protein